MLISYLKCGYIDISVLQEYANCPRRCALLFREKKINHHTFVQIELDNHHLNKFANSKKTVIRNIEIVSGNLGIKGNVHIAENKENSDKYKITPIIFKKKEDNLLANSVSLCAASICLEEMMDIQVERGYILCKENLDEFSILLDDNLRLLAKEKSHGVHIMMSSSELPKRQNYGSCKNCIIQKKCAEYSELI